MIASVLKASASHLHRIQVLNLQLHPELDAELAQSLASTLPLLPVLRELVLEFETEFNTKIFCTRLSRVVWQLPGVRKLKLGTSGSGLSTVCVLPDIVAPNLQSFQIEFWASPCALDGVLSVCANAIQLRDLCVENAQINETRCGQRCLFCMVAVSVVNALGSR